MRASKEGIWILCAALALCAAGCASDAPRATATFNQSAALAGELPTNPLAWRMIASIIDPKARTMSTLYGNDVAVAYARTHSQQDYPAGSILSLVTWTKAEDPRWFGANIPAQVKSVEFVTVGAPENAGSRYSYEEYTGNPLKKEPSQQSGVAQERVSYLLSSRAAVMP